MKISDLWMLTSILLFALVCKTTPSLGATLRDSSPGLPTISKADLFRAIVSKDLDTVRHSASPEQAASLIIDIDRLGYTLAILGNDQPMLSYMITDNRYDTDFVESPISTAAACGRHEMINFLINKGYSLASKGANTKTPLCSAHQGCAITALDRYEAQPDNLKLNPAETLPNGFRVQAGTAAGISDRLIFYAKVTDEQKLKSLELLIDAGADVQTMCTSYPMSPIAYILNGSILNKRFGSWPDPFFSTSGGMKDYLAALLDAGADINKMSDGPRSRFTALDCANEWGDDNITVFLKEHGAKSAKELNEPLAGLCEPF